MSAIQIHIYFSLKLTREVDLCLKALVDEDRLLSRLGLLENQLSVYAKVTINVLH